MSFKSILVGSPTSTSFFFFTPQLISPQERSLAHARMDIAMQDVGCSSHEIQPHSWIHVLLANVLHQENQKKKLFWLNFNFVYLLVK
jgi:hypothetical protein